MKVAYFGVPHIGGTHTVFTSLRRALAPEGVELRWVGTGPKAAAMLIAPQWRSEAACGEVVAGEIEDPRERVAALAHHVGREGYDAVIGNVLGDPVQMEALRHLPNGIRRLMIVHNITRATYAAAGALRAHVDATVAVSPRIRRDLLARGFSPASVHAIPTGVEVAAPERVSRSDALRLLFLGRLDDVAKGVMWLPAIMRRLPLGAATLTIAGDGPAIAALRQAFAAEPRRRVRILGAVAREQAAGLLAEHDVLLFPSRYEGQGLSLLEAMKAGCVPVASRIRGVTDHMVEDGVSGLLFRVGDSAAAAAAIARLAVDPALLERLSEAARRRAAEHFGIEEMADRYLRLLESPFRHRTGERIAVRWSGRGWLSASLAAALPVGVKKLAYELRER